MRQLLHGEWMTELITAPRKKRDIAPAAQVRLPCAGQNLEKINFSFNSLKESPNTALAFEGQSWPGFSEEPAKPSEQAAAAAQTSERQPG